MTVASPPNPSGSASRPALPYNAFLSYSHAADGRLAPTLQSALEKLGKPWFKIRALNLFRDRTGLGLSDHLWPDIERAIRSSQTFILLASPESATSHWVQKELKVWLALERPLYIVLTDGDLSFEEIQPGRIRASGSALPELLCDHFTHEPLYLDLRWAHGRDRLDLQNSQFRDSVSTLAASIRGISKQDFDSAATREHRRNLRAASAAITILGILLIVSTALAFYARTQQLAAIGNAARAEQNEKTANDNADRADTNRHQAEKNREQAETHRQSAVSEAARAKREETRAVRNEARAIKEEQRAKTRLGDNLFANARQHLLERHPLRSLAYVRAYDDLFGTDVSKSFKILKESATEAARNHLLTVQVAPYSGGLTLFSYADVSPDYDGNIHVVRGKFLLTLSEGLDPVGEWEFDADRVLVTRSGLLFKLKDRALEVFRHADQSLLRRLSIQQEPSHHFAVSERGHFAYIGKEHLLELYSPTSNSPILSRALEADDKSLFSLAISPRGDCLAIENRGKVTLFDTGSGQTYSIASSKTVGAMAFISDTNLVLNTDGAFAVWSCPGANEVARLTFTGSTSSFATSGTGGILGATSGRRLVWADNVLDRAYTFESPALASEITAIALAPDNRHASVGMEDGQLLVLDLWSGSILIDVDASRRRIRELQFVPTTNGLRVVSVSAAHDVQIWQVPRGPLSIHSSMWRHALTPDGKNLLTVTPDGTASVTSTDSGKPIASTKIKIDDDGSLDLAMSGPPSNLALITAWKSIGDKGDGRGRAAIWRYGDGKQIEYTGTERYQLHPFAIPNRVLLRSHDGGHHRLIDVELGDIAKLDQTVIGVDERRIFMSAEKILMSKEAVHPEQIRTLPLQSTPNKLAIHDNTALVETVDDDWWMVDLAGFKVRCKLASKQGFLSRFAFSSDGRILATTAEAEANTFSPMKTVPIELWNTAACSHAGSLKGHDRGVDDLFFARRNTMLFASTWDQRAHGWSLPDRIKRSQLGTDNEPVRSLTMILNDTLAVSDSGSMRGPISFWDLGTQESILRVGESVHTHRMVGDTLLLERDSWMTVLKVPWIAGRDSPALDTTCVARWKLSTSGQLTEMPSKLGICRSKRHSPNGPSVREFSNGLEAAIGAGRVGRLDAAVYLASHYRQLATRYDWGLQSVAALIVESALIEMSRPGRPLSTKNLLERLTRLVNERKSIHSEVWAREIALWAVKVFENLGATETSQQTLLLARRLKPSAVSNADLAEIHVLTAPIGELSALAPKLLAHLDPRMRAMLWAEVWARLLLNSKAEASNAANEILNLRDSLSHEESQRWSFAGALERLRLEGGSTKDRVKVRELFNLLATKATRDKVEDLLKSAQD
jgi:WD40 repeat protein